MTKNMNNEQEQVVKTSIPFSNDEWATLSTNFHSTLFRLEALPEYDSTNEHHLIAAFERGEIVPVSGPLKEFFASQKHLVLDGKSIERVHIVPDQLTPYLKWEILWCYRHLADAGVKVYLLPESKRPDLTARAFEFYLIDDQYLIDVVYGPRGKFLELRRETDEARIAEARNLRNEILREAIPYDIFVAGLT